MAGAGLPHLVVGYLIKKRYDDFTTKFPDAIELLVRGLRSGLPVTETLGIRLVRNPRPGGSGIQAGDRTHQDRAQHG
jgi:tight adherence protein B